jgi:hypothetical protein
MKCSVLRNVMLYILIGAHQLMKECTASNFTSCLVGLFFDPECRGSTFVHVSKVLPDYTMSHPR